MSLYKKTKKGKQIIKLVTLTTVVVCLITILYLADDKSAIVTKIKEDVYDIDITVTKNHGDSQIYTKTVSIKPGVTAMDVLKQTSDVVTSYLGGFVESINGVKSSYESNQKNDWFYYINGLLSPIGASEYILHPGDIERWDYHSWDSNRKTTAIISDYPEPFLHGFHGKTRITTIVYDESFYDQADALYQSLKKIGLSVSSKTFDDLSENEKSNNNLILVGHYSNDLIGELNENAEKLGWFIEYKNRELITFNEKGEKNLNFDSGSVIIATQNPWNPKGNWNGENVVWVLTGVASENVIDSVELLLENNGEIQNCTSLIIYENEIIKVP